MRLPATGAERLAAVLDAASTAWSRRAWSRPRRSRRSSPASATRRSAGAASGRGAPASTGAAPRSGTPTTATCGCTVQIESPAGVDAAAEIAAVDGVDALVVGCSDLSLELDVPQDLESRPLRAAVAAVAAAAAGAGVRFGVAASGDPVVVAVLAERADLLVYSADARIYSAAVDAAARALEGIDAAV